MQINKKELKEIIEHLQLLNNGLGWIVSERIGQQLTKLGIFRGYTVIRLIKERK